MTTLFFNGNVRTLDPARPIASSFVVDRGRFAEVDGPHCDRSKCDFAVDLEGQTVIPGFNDNHLHALSFGEYASRPDLAGMNESDIIDSLKTHYRAAPPGVLLTGHRWDYPFCPNPHRDVLDRAFPENPVVLFQYGGHAGWANSRALALMGVSRSKPDPLGTTAIRDQNNVPTGVVNEIILTKYVSRDYRRKFVVRDVNRRYLRFALKAFSQHGVTSVHDNTWSFVTVASLADMERRNLLSARFSCWTYGEDRLYAALMELSPRDGERYKRGPFKYFLDGTFSAKTAWLHEPYAIDPSNAGNGKPREQILRILKRSYRRNRQAAFHAIGDRAVSEFLDALEQLHEVSPDAKYLRFRIEHAQLIRPRDIERLKNLDVLIAAQPSALVSPGKDFNLIGAERTERAYPYRSLIEAGVPLSFGSDFPGESTFAPLENIHLAVNRDGPERITAEQALHAYTCGSAYAEFAEHEKGRIKAGMLADFAVLDADPVAVPSEEIKNIEVLKTYIGGDAIN